MTLDNLMVTIFIWQFHIKYSSNNILRNLKYFTCSIGFPSIESCNSSIFLTSMKSHAFFSSTFKVNLLCFNQKYALSNSVVICLA